MNVRKSVVMESVKSKAPALAHKRVLVVDDLPEILEFFEQVVRRLRGFNVEIATEVNSQRALELVERERFDVVVSDYRMRQVDGITILTKAREVNPSCRRILITGYNEIPTSLARIREADVDAYLQKPLHTDDFLLLFFDILHNNHDTLATLRQHARELERMATGDSDAVRVRP